MIRSKEEQKVPDSQNLSADNLRNDGLDVLKCICAFLVVTIHCPTVPGITGEIITAINRIAVPVFFMITGWFYQKTVARRREKIQIIKVLKLLIWSSLFYFVFNGIIAIVNGKISDYIRSYLSIKILVKFLVLTSSPFQGHLWYLSALLYVLIIIGWADRKIGREKLYWLIPVLLIGDLAFGKYSLFLWGRAFPTSLVRNWLFVGIPYFLLGDCMACNRDKLRFLFDVKRMWLYFFFVCFVSSTLLEKFLLVFVNLNAERNHFISSTFLSIIAFVLAIQQSNRIDGGLFGWFIQVGRRYSTIIYIVHPAFLTICSLLAAKLFFASDAAMEIYCWITPILVFLVSLGFSVLFVKMEARLIRK